MKFGKPLALTWSFIWQRYKPFRQNYMKHVRLTEEAHGSSSVDVTLPMIIPDMTISVMMSVINEMKQFDLVKVITDGGPGSSTETIAYNIISQAFGNNLLGYSSAIALVLFVGVVLVSLVQIFISRKFKVEN